MFNNEVLGRAMLDNCSSKHFITSAFCNKLKIPKQRTYVPISGLGQTAVATATSKVKLTIKSRFNRKIKYQIEALVVPRISGNQPAEEININGLQQLNSLDLADPEFNIPAPIDILIGAELYFEITTGSNSNLPTTINSTLGWLVGGGNNQEVIRSHQAFMTTNNHNQGETDDLNHTMKQFWELESIPEASSFSSEEQRCEEYFSQTYTRDPEGRFIVRYPFKETPQQCLGESLPTACRRLKQVEKRLQKPEQVAYKREYLKFMKDYEDLGHMIEVEPPNEKSKFRYYIPHHFVLKSSSTTTKFRVVFDASAKTTNGKSLNDIIMSGPIIQDSLSNLIMKFRTNKIAMTGDIEKMFRQILMHPEDQEYQHIVWRESPDVPMRHFKLLTVTYGTACGTYLSVKVLHKLAELEKLNYPLAANSLLNDFYVDDCMTGSNTVKHTIEIQQQLVKVLSTAKMNIRKFTSSSKEVLKALNTDQIENKFISFDNEEGVKTLGIFWNPKDYFGFHTNTTINSEPKSYTKRYILSEISKLFNPIGWLASIVIRAKNLMQTIWKENLQWDDQVPNHITKQWDPGPE